MLKRSYLHFPVPGCTGAVSLLSLSILLGLLLGVWFSGSAGGLFVSSMRAVVSSRVSVIGLFSSVMLPLLVSAFAVYIRQPLFLFPIAFCKAFLFAYTCCGLLYAWGSAGWLVSGLLMLQSACAMPVLCWYWLRHAGGRPFDALSFGAALAALGMIGIMYFCFIVPFWANIITF